MSTKDLKDTLQGKVNRIVFLDNEADEEITDEATVPNLALYNKVRAVPPEALKEIQGGKLKGKSDINPLWRIKTLTEQFGICGIGWRYEIVSERLEAGANGEVASFVKINLYIKHNGEWSEAIPGTGGSMLVNTEKGSLCTNDEAFKMALTDALSVACKSLGVAADVYWERDKTKYGNSGNPTEQEPPMSDNPSEKVLTDKQLNRLHAIRKSADISEETLKKIMQNHFQKGSAHELSYKEYDFLCTQLEELKAKQKKSA
jgi:hypothetical protein